MSGVSEMSEIKKCQIAKHVRVSGMSECHACQSVRNVGVSTGSQNVRRSPHLALQSNPNALCLRSCKEMQRRCVWRMVSELSFLVAF